MKFFFDIIIAFSFLSTVAEENNSSSFGPKRRPCSQGLVVPLIEEWSSYLPAIFDLLPAFTTDGKLASDFDANNFDNLGFLVSKTISNLSGCIPNSDLQTAIMNILILLLDEMRTFRVNASNGDQIESVKISDEIFDTLNLTWKVVSNDWNSLETLLIWLEKNSEIWYKIKGAVLMNKETWLDCSKYVNVSRMNVYRNQFEWESKKFNIPFRRSPFYHQLLPWERCIRDSQFDLTKHPFSNSNPFTIKVSILVAPQCLISLTNDGELSLITTLIVSWTDTRMRLDFGEFRFPEALFFHPNEIWIPLIWIDRCTSENCLVEPLNSTYVEMNSLGHISYHFKYKINVLCETKFLRFPFDNQICRIILYIWEMDFQFEEPNIFLRYPKLFNREWILSEEPSAHSRLLNVLQKKYRGGKEKFHLPALEYRLFFHRNPKYYIQNLITPVIIISLPGTFVVFLTPESGD